MNFFANGGDIARGVMNFMNNNLNVGNQKQNTLRKNLESCTYPDQTKYMIQKAVKQVFHVYPFFNVDILMFTENGFACRYIELKGILQIQIKGKTCKVDFNMMLPKDYPRSPPFVRIVNRNPDYRVDPFYQSLQSKTDKSSYILNQKLNSWINWQSSSSLVNVIIECYDMLKIRFPFSKPTPENNYGGNNAWGSQYNNKNNESYGFINPNTNNNNNNSWGSNNNWGNNNAPNNTWGINTAWGNNNNVGWGNKNNNWNNNNQWQGNIGGMGGIIPSNPVNTIASAQKYVGKQKQILTLIHNQYLKVLQKNQILDTTKQSLESEESYLRKQNFEMSNFLKSNEQSSSPDLTSIVSPGNERSEQILDLASSLKAREECIGLLQTRFCNQQIPLEQFMKQLRKIQQARFEEKVLLQKCIRNSA